MLKLLYKELYKEGKMKKYISILICLCLLTGNCFAETKEKTENKIAPAFVRVTTNMLGYNFIAKKIAQNVLKNTLKKSVDGKYKVKFDSFSGVDLKKGKFKGLTISGENLHVENELYVTKLYMKTLSDFNYVDYTKDPMTFKTDMPMSYEVEMTEGDLNKTLTIGRNFDLITSFIPFVSVDKPTINLMDEKIRIKSALKLPLGKNVKFSMSAGVKVENGKIVLTNVESSKNQNDMANKFVNIINNQNILENISFKLFEGADSQVTVETVKITDKKLYINGKVVIKKA